MSSVSFHKKRIEDCLRKNIQINEREAQIEAEYILRFALKKPSSFFISNQKFKIDKKLMSYAKKDSIFLHCLPRGSEVSDEVFLGKKSHVWQQALN